MTLESQNRGALANTSSKHTKTERRNLPYGGSNKSRLVLVVQHQLIAKDPDEML